MSLPLHGSRITGRGSARWIGDTTRPEFSALLSFLQHQVPVQCMDLASTLSDVTLQQDLCLIVFATTDTSGDRDVACAALHERYPDAVIVQVLDAWCERSGRTLDHDKAFHRVPWHAFCGWWAHRFLNTVSASAVPESSFRELLATVEPFMLRVGMVAANEEIAEIHGSTLRSLQITSQWLPSLTPVARLNPFDVFVWDESADGRARPVPLATLSDAVAGRPIVALRSPVNITHALNANILFVGKPYVADELVSLVRMCVDHEQQGVRRLARTA